MTLSRRAMRARRPRMAWIEAQAAVARRAGGRCEARQDGCTGRHQDTHHVILRSQGGTNDLDNLLAVCSPCHAWIHANPAAARLVGLIRRPSAPGGQ